MVKSGEVKLASGEVVTVKVAFDERRGVDLRPDLGDRR
jgi:hypothetical protein